jgi:hypothetical protein
MIRLALFCTLVAMAAGLLAAVLTGCGAGQDSGVAEAGSPAYAKLLVGLKRAALSNGTYGGVRRAQALDKADEAVVHAFCKFAWQTVANDEVEQLKQHTFTPARIRYTAEVTVNGWRDAHQGIAGGPIRARMGELRSIIHLADLNLSLVRSYSKACFR